MPITWAAADLAGARGAVHAGRDAAAICVSSANDAAVAVAELVGGSEPVFVEQMNARAAELGMTNTTFRNACGLDTEGHLSTRGMLPS